LPPKLTSVGSARKRKVIPRGRAAWLAGVFMLLSCVDSSWLHSDKGIGCPDLSIRGGRHGFDKHQLQRDTCNKEGARTMPAPMRTEAG
jgi:hypothetical protein